MKRLFTSVLLTTLSLASFGQRAIQEIDSIYKITVSMISEHCNDSALVLSQYMLQESTKIDYELGKARAILASGLYFLNQSQLDTADILLNRASQMYQERFAIDLMDEALAVADSSGISDLEEEFDYVNTQIFFQREVYDSAIFYGKEALRETAVVSNKRFSWALAYKVSEAYEKLNRLDSALHYYKLYHTFKDSLLFKESQSKFTELYAEIKTLDMQKEIEVSRKEIEIDEANKAQLITSIVGIIVFFLGITIFLACRNKQLKLESEIEEGQSALQQQTLHMMNLNNSIQEIESGLKSMKRQEVVLGKDVQSLLNSIFVNRSFEREWEQLGTHFSKIHPNFNSQLLRRHDNLTQKERRLLALVKLDLNTREIAGILSIEQRSVVMSRYRLKQKLGLQEKEDLDAYVQAF